MKRIRRLTLLLSLALLLTAPALWAETTHRLHRGLTAYVVNPEGKPFRLTLAVRDLNLYANGPREVLLKIYDPDGRPVVREVIPDDGCVSPNFPARIGGWDHELQYYANLYAKGTAPTVRWSAWSEPQRLQTIKARAVTHEIKGGAKGIYRIVLAGTPDHYVTLSLDPQLKYGLAGHPTWMHGHGDLLGESYIYVPKGTSGIFFAIAEPDQPRTRRFTLRAPDGTVLFDGKAKGGYSAPGGKLWRSATAGVKVPGGWDGKLLRLSVSPGKNDYLVKVTLQQPRKGAFKDYVGMGSLAVYAPDAETARAIAGGTIVHDDLVFWHPFQIRFHEWLKQNTLDGNDQERALRKQLETVFDYCRLFETSDGRGTLSWTNWAYAFGYYGCKIWHPAWQLMKRDDVPAEVKAILREALIMGGDRLSFATGIERVNGNAFAQIPVALWYAKDATGDPLLTERFETFWKRWANEGWGPGVGLSPSGDAQEHFAHDLHYGSYLMDNWHGGHWLDYSILEDAKGDLRWRRVIDRYAELYSYLHCLDENGRNVPACPWSARTNGAVHAGEKYWSMGDREWKGKPGPDFTVNMNDGSEWFAARRKDYYMLTFHGRLAPEWMSRSFEGQLGFGGGVICQLQVPGKGPVLTSTLNGSYGKGMHPSNWRNFHIHSIVGVRWDGRPIISGISEHADARLEGNKLTSSGEIRDAHLKVHRTYVFGEDGISCEAALSTSDYASVLSIWSHERRWSELKEAYEMIPYHTGRGKSKVTVGLQAADGGDLGEADQTFRKAGRVRIDRGGYGVDVVLAEPMPVALGANRTVLIRLTPEAEALTPAEKVRVQYRLVPYREGGKP